MRSMSTYISQISSLRGSQSGKRALPRRHQDSLQPDVLANIGSAWRRVGPAIDDIMASVSPATVSGQAEASAVSLPWSAPPGFLTMLQALYREYGSVAHYAG